MKLLIILMAVLLMSTAKAETTASIENQAEPWPAMVDGRPITKAFRFKPTRIEYITEGRKIETRLVVLYINDASVPANRFAVSLFGSEEHIKARIEELLAVDDGYVTVDAIWVNLPLNVYQPGSGIIPLLHNRILIGELRGLPK